MLRGAGHRLKTCATGAGHRLKTCATGSRAQVENLCYGGRCGGGLLLDLFRHAEDLVERGDPAEGLLDAVLEHHVHPSADRRPADFLGG